VAADGLLADQPDDVEVGLDGVEVEERRAELLRSGDGDLARIGEVVLDEVADDGVRRSRAPASASNIVASDTRPSATSAGAGPGRSAGAPPVEMAKSFIDSSGLS